MIEAEIDFTAPVWLWNADQAWHFVTVPADYTEQIKFYGASGVGLKKRGFGSVKVRVMIDEVTWQTSVFPDKKSGTYLLPLKKDVRQKAGISVGDEVTVKLRLSTNAL